MATSGDNMGSNAEPLFKRHIHPRIKLPGVDGLKKLVKLMPPIPRISFGAKYGKLLRLLHVDTQVDAISALIQFYDPPIRCFTFQDFQLAPTLEEYAQILGYPLKDVKPYQRPYGVKLIQETAKVLKVEEVELEKKKKSRNDVDGFPLDYLEQRMRHFVEINDWASFGDVLALTLFGTVLFPHIDDYVDFTSIDVFLAFRNRGESPVSAVLADTYFTLTRCHEKKGRKVSCCLPVLYVWLITRAFVQRCEVTCPIEYVKLCDVGSQSGDKWSQTLADLNEKTIHWNPKWLDAKDMIYQCGSYPNVPLIGTKGCINYNPSVVLRQLCYPMSRSPTDEMAARFIVFKEDQGEAETLKKVRHAWEHIQKGKELGKRSNDAKDSHRHWLKARVQQVKLPFQSSLPAIEEVPVQPLSSSENEEIKELKISLSKSEEEKKELREELRKIRRDYDKLQLKDTQKTTFIERVNKRARAEEERKLKFQDNLRASDESLTLRKRERDQAIFDRDELEEQLRRSKAAERDVKRQLDDLKQQLENVVAEYKERVEIERQQKEELASRYNDLLRTEYMLSNGLREQVREHHEKAEEYRQEMMAWMDHSTKLAWLANQAIMDIPELLEKAEEKILPFETPKEIIEFIEHCGVLFREMKNFTRFKK